MADKKLQIALYWGAACGGCDVAVLDTNEFILDVAAVADIRLWPIAVDGKYTDVEAMADGELDLAIFNGAVRNCENEHIAKLLRQKSKILRRLRLLRPHGRHPGPGQPDRRGRRSSSAPTSTTPRIEPGNTTVPQPETQRRTARRSTSPSSTSGSTSSTTSSTSTTTCPAARRRPTRSRRCCWPSSRASCRPRARWSGASEHGALRRLPAHQEREEDQAASTGPGRSCRIPTRCLLEQGILCAGVGHALRLRRALPEQRHTAAAAATGRCPDVRRPGRQARSAPSPRSSTARTPRRSTRSSTGCPTSPSFAYRFGVPASLLQRSHRP